MLRLNGIIQKPGRLNTRSWAWAQNKKMRGLEARKFEPVRAAPNSGKVWAKVFNKCVQNWNSLTRNLTSLEFFSQKNSKKEKKELARLNFFSKMFRLLKNSFFGKNVRIVFFRIGPKPKQVCSENVAGIGIPSILIKILIAPMKLLWKRLRKFWDTCWELLI